MNKPSIIQTLSIAAAALLGLGAIQAQAQSVTFDFAGGSNQGWSLGGFSGGTPPTISLIGSSYYLLAPNGAFQVANVASGYAGNLPTFNAAMGAALNNPSGYDLSYNWYVDTSTFTTNTTFLQLGTYVNAGSGYYSQNYGSPNQVQLSGAQIATGGIFQGTITVPFTVFSADANAATETFFRLGLVVNGNGTGVGGYFNDISISPVPEPGTLSLCGLGLAAGAAFLRRRKA
jgi:hypothetical protein